MSTAFKENLKSFRLHFDDKNLVFCLWKNISKLQSHQSPSCIFTGLAQHQRQRVLSSIWNSLAPRHEWLVLCVVCTELYVNWSLKPWSRLVHTCQLLSGWVDSELTSHFILYIFSGQMKYGAPEILFQKLYFLWPDKIRSTEENCGKLEKAGIPAIARKLASFAINCRSWNNPKHPDALVPLSLAALNFLGPFLGRKIFKAS